MNKPEISSHVDKDFDLHLDYGHDTTKGLEILEAAYIEYIYRLARYNQMRASRLLGISRGCLRLKLKQYFGEKYINAQEN